MARAKAPVTTEVSTDYFRLRGRLMTIQAEAAHTSASESLCEFRSEVQDAHLRGALSDAHYEELMRLADEVPATAQRSEEFLRLKSRHTSLTANGRVMNAAEREDFEEEISLALNSGSLSPQEAIDLRALSSTVAADEGPKIIDIPQRRKASDAPSRKRAAEQRNQHTARYEQLVQEYRALYDSDMSTNRENRARLFFRNVEAAYRHEEITMAEYKEFHAAMNDTEAFLSDVEIPVNSRDFDFLRERVVASVSSNEALMEIAKQIGAWAKCHGTPEKLVKSNPLGVALQNLDAFLASGEQLVAIGDKAVNRKQLLQMRL